MRRPTDAAEVIKKNIALSLVAALLIFAGLIALFAPELIRALLPPEIAAPLVQNALLFLILGFVLEGYFVVRVVRAAMAQVKRAMREAAMNSTAAGSGNDFPNDPVAQRTQWTPAQGGGANFRTRKLVARGPGRIEVRPTVQILLFCWVFIVAGLAIGLGFGFAGRGKLASADVLAPAAFGLAFTSIGLIMLHVFAKPAVFDRQAGWYWRGSPSLRSQGDIRRQKQATELTDIHALQLITEHVSGNKSSYNSYEMNLVLKDGQRLNVMDHGDRNAVTADAETLARFLGVPVWSRLDGAP